MSDERIRRRWIAIVLCLAAIALFYIENHGAYRGYFSEDDLVNITWPTFVGNDVFEKGLVSPAFDASNFRPVGFLYYRYAGRGFGLNYPPYVALLQLFHILNAVLLWFLLRTFGFSPLGAWAGAIFYGLNAVVMEAYWKPMYVFDVLCATFCLTALILYLRGRWIWAFLAFWLAYKSKELAVMLPLVLLACEWWLGEKRWKRLIPFFAASACFGVGALFHNRAVLPSSDYNLSFAPASLWHALLFYSGALLLFPAAALVLLALPFFIRDRRLYIGLILAGVMLAPLLALSHRLRAVYWYVPLIGLAIVMAAIASRMKPWVLAALALAWLPLNYAVLREKRRDVLAAANENRWFLHDLQAYKRMAPPLRAVVYDNPPGHIRAAAEAAIHLVFGPDVDAAWIDEPRAEEVMKEVPVAVVTYVPPTHQLQVRLRTTPIE